MKSSTDELMPIWELAERFELAPHVLRHWESMGLLSPATRVNGRRRYGHQHVHRVAVILRCKAGGLSLDQVRQVLTASDPAERRGVLAEHRADLDRRIAEMETARTMIDHALNCRAKDIAQCPDFLRIVENSLSR
jgi:MerR family transcriptional regulator, copper efflux regulator